MGYRALSCVTACALVALGVTSQALAVSAPTDLLQAMGVNPWRDLDGQTPTGEVYVVTEDRVGTNGYVGPWYGGQRYDWEGMYAWWTETHAYVVLVAGFPITTAQNSRVDADAPSAPDSAIAGVDFKDGNDPTSYAGDILIDVSQDGTWDYGISMGAYTGAVGRAGLAYGDLYRVDQAGGYAATGTYRAGIAVASPWLGLSQENLGALDFSTEKIKVTQQLGEDMSGTLLQQNRYLAAFAIDLVENPDFSQAPIAWHWTMECGNDVANLETPWLPPPSPPEIPEPTTMLLLAAGAAAAAVARRRPMTTSRQRRRG